MPSPSEQREREAGQTRAQLLGTVEELRARMTPGQVIDQLLDYAREGPLAEFRHKLVQQVRENPLPLVLIGIGIAWLIVASSRSSSGLIVRTADSVTKAAGDISTTATAVVSKDN